VSFGATGTAFATRAWRTRRIGLRCAEASPEGDGPSISSSEMDAVATGQASRPPIGPGMVQPFAGRSRGSSGVPKQLAAAGLRLRQPDGDAAGTGRAAGAHELVSVPFVLGMPG